MNQVLLAKDAWKAVAEFQSAMKEVLERILGSEMLLKLKLRFLNRTVDQ